MCRPGRRVLKPWSGLQPFRPFPTMYPFLPSVPLVSSVQPLLLLLSYLLSSLLSHASSLRVFALGVVRMADGSMLTCGGERRPRLRPCQVHQRCRSIQCRTIGLCSSPSVTTSRPAGCGPTASSFSPAASLSPALLFSPTQLRTDKPRPPALLALRSTLAREHAKGRGTTRRDGALSGRRLAQRGGEQAAGLAYAATCFNRPRRVHIYDDK